LPFANIDTPLPPPEPPSSKRGSNSLLCFTYPSCDRADRSFASSAGTFMPRQSTRRQRNQARRIGAGTLSVILYAQVFPFSGSGCLRGDGMVIWKKEALCISLQQCIKVVTHGIEQKVRCRRLDVMKSAVEAAQRAER
jgi:hypothetical protein